MFQLLEPDFSHEDTRGKLVQLAHCGYSQINVVYSNAGTIRGGHYHKKNIEAFYVVSGSCEVCFQAEDNRKTQVFTAGQFFCIKPNIIHTFKYLQDTILIGLYDIGVEMANGEKDIFRADV